MVIDPIGGVRLGAFDGESKSTIPHQRGKDSKGTRHTKKNSVKVGFIKAIVLQNNTTVRIHIGPRVLGFTMFSQNLEQRSSL